MNSLRLEVQFLADGAVVQVFGRQATYVIARRDARASIPVELSTRGGAYLLLGDPDARGTRIAYVGQSADETGSRLASHDKQKMWWRTFVDITPNKAEIPRDLSMALERQLHDAISDSVGITMENLQLPPDGRSELQSQVAHDILRELQIVLKGTLDLNLIVGPAGRVASTAGDVDALEREESLAIDDTRPSTPVPANGRSGRQIIAASLPPITCRIGTLELKPRDWTEVWTWTIESIASLEGNEPVREWLLNYHVRTPRVRTALATLDERDFPRKGTWRPILGLTVGTNFSAPDLTKLAKGLAEHFRYSLELSFAGDEST